VSATCPNYFFGSNTTRKCEVCSFTCLHCNSGSATGCIECRPNFYLTPTNECLTNCPINYFENSTTWTCDICHTNCDDCLTNQPN